MMGLLQRICRELPVDGSRIYFVGASMGGYGVFRLSELLPELPAALVPMAAYYPEMPREDHSGDDMVERIKKVPFIKPYHCREDKICRPDKPLVGGLYNRLGTEANVTVEWVPPSVCVSKSGS